MCMFMYKNYFILPKKILPMVWRGKAIFFHFIGNPGYYYNIRG